jgi:predicted HTH transcriptional regulator
VLKTVAGFLNAHGGTLMVGVDDDGKVLGLAADGFPNEDKMGLHLVNLIRDRIGDVFLPYVYPHFEDELLFHGVAHRPNGLAHHRLINAVIDR